ncbi:hypothetical protein MCOR30_011787 [Pyricularia oryzae]|nr:hypothetical protein MCOR30_011787 [Pyricularia oryzae]KAI6479538.1 hypothetical protein MCOR13_011433 [Pyricularia oryzae]
MVPEPRAFYRLWQKERVLEGIYVVLPKQDVCSLRLANSACCNLVTKRIFLQTHLTFTATSFTKASRSKALSRIGQHIQHLIFTFAHSESTFLPPLVHPVTGHEISFLYAPYTHMASSHSRVKYGNSGLADVLTQQYPPLFHSATNVPSFINAFNNLPNVRHLTIRCPGQDARERYRRSIVDYALISLRICMERAPLDKLNKLTLSSVHPSAFLYLRHAPGFGCLPSASRRWRQIQKLYVQVDSWDFCGPSPGLDHLKIIEDYIRLFAPNLSKFSFTWLGSGGPCPIALSDDPMVSPPRGSQKLSDESTFLMSPLLPCHGRKPIAFPRLRQLTIRNATTSATQTSTLVRAHQSSVRDFNFEKHERDHYKATDLSHRRTSSPPHAKKQNQRKSKRENHLGEPSPVKRNLEQEEAHRRLAEDPDALKSELQKAKAVVKSKLMCEPCTGLPQSPAVLCARDAMRLSAGTRS